MVKVGGEEGEGELYGGSNIEIYNTMCNINSGCEVAYNTGSSTLCSVTT